MVLEIHFGGAGCGELGLTVMAGFGTVDVDLILENSQYCGMTRWMFPSGTKGIRFSSDYISFCLFASRQNCNDLPSSAYRTFLVAELLSSSKILTPGLTGVMMPTRRLP
jgi:hypothetical protein